MTDARLSLLAGAACGLLWWLVSLMLGARAYGVLGAHPMTGSISGALTGVLVTAASIAFYRRSSVRALYWYSPLSVYAAVAIYAFLAFVIRLAVHDFHPDQIPWAVGLQSLLGMWWGITVLLPVALPVQLLAYANHCWLRRVVVAS